MQSPTVDLEQQNLETVSFPTSIKAIQERIDQFDPVQYGRTRNFLQGGVSRLSPYISRGVISTAYVWKRLQERGFELKQMEKFVQELAWRDYWQLKWQVLGDAINKKGARHTVAQGIPESILSADTTIKTIDCSIDRLHNTGYMHNHFRMYVSMLICNIGQYNWYDAARWMYYHLLDGDWASNALSWQWVAGVTRTKKYYANQENINTYSQTDQQKTYLDTTYDQLVDRPVPIELHHVSQPHWKTVLPTVPPIHIHPDRPTLIYNYYNLDPFWRVDEEVNRILLLEPDHFAEYPVSEQCIRFVLELSENIAGIQIHVGSFESLKQHGGTFVFKEHPLNRHYIGIEDSRDWMFDVKGDFSSFFQFWKKAIKSLKNEQKAH